MHACTHAHGHTFDPSECEKSDERSRRASPIHSRTQKAASRRNLPGARAWDAGDLRAGPRQRSRARAQAGPARLQRGPWLTARRNHDLPRAPTGPSCVVHYAVRRVLGCIAVDMGV